jgi:GTPase Era involved in 16S rRNA processing
MQTKQTSVEFLREKLLELFEDNLPFELLDEAEEIEKQNLKTAWASSEQNMRFQFSSSAYKGITFEQWYNSFKELKNE